jgi:UDP-N-acetylmuramoyl-tripeptide--D-alanyl-D-alanine ligase
MIQKLPKQRSSCVAEVQRVQLELLDVAAMCAGQLHGRQSARVTSVHSDTRVLPAGALFVALKGEQFDGHSYLARAQQQGAVAAVVQTLDDSCNLPQIQVHNTQHALGVLAREWLKRMRCKRIALTGSNGKTTVKNLTSAILSNVGQTCATIGNFNNEIGLPLTVLRVRAGDQFAVLEMGAGAPGDIEYLASVGLPQVAIVNNAAAAHLERLISVEAVAHEKAAIYRALPKDGVAIIPLDDAHRAEFIEAAKHVRQLTFGLAPAAQIRAEAIEMSAHTRFKLVGPFGDALIELPILGLHNVRNALAAAALSYAAGADLPAIVAGLQSTQAAGGRLQQVHQVGGWYLIDDSYNANPGSVMAAIDTLRVLPGKPILVLGDMAELGENSPQLHAQVFDYAKQQGLSTLFCLGPKAAAAAHTTGFGRAFASLELLIAALQVEITSESQVLVKGSRSSKMERVVAGISSGAAAC